MAAVIEIQGSGGPGGPMRCLLSLPIITETYAKGLIQHHAAIADTVHIPIIISNVPSRTNLRHNSVNIEGALKDRQYCRHKRGKRGYGPGS